MGPGHVAPLVRRWEDREAEEAQQAQAARAHQAQAPGVVASPRKRRRGRRHGWRRFRGDVRLDAVRIVLEEDRFDPRFDYDAALWEEPIAEWEVTWWTPLIQPHPFLSEGVVHMTMRYAREAVCGEPCVPYGVMLHSSEAAMEYAKMCVIDPSEVTCFFCTAWM